MFISTVKPVPDAVLTSAEVEVSTVCGTSVDDSDFGEELSVMSVAFCEDVEYEAFEVVPFSKVIVFVGAVE